MHSRIENSCRHIEAAGAAMRAHESSGDTQDAPGSCGPFSSASSSPVPEERVVRELALAHLCLATAESCTGGLLAARITDVPGASEVFSLGLVTYSNGMKMRLLDVPEAVLARCGAVSEEVAELMAANVRALAGSDFGIGVTGIAGPGGGSAAKPVGLVHICVAGPKAARRFALRPAYPWPGRDAVRRSACDAALEALLSMLE